jgi:hypothetical protein
MLRVRLGGRQILPGQIDRVAGRGPPNGPIRGEIAAGVWFALSKCLK